MRPLQMFIAGFLSACASHPPSHNEPDLEHAPQIEHSVAAGWPFRVKAWVGDYDGPRSFVPTIRTEFLRLLADAPFAAQIRLVTIDARSPIYGSWKCVIERNDGHNPIVLRESTPFYEVESSHPYRKAVEAVWTQFREQ